MQVFRHFYKPAGFPLALAIGNFDGMHLGHQALMQGLVANARPRGLKSAVMTFEPHPREFFIPERAPTRLTSLREKLELFAEAGVDYVYVCHFNRRFAEVTAVAFMHDILQRLLDVKTILVGEDFRFGAGRRGTIDDFRSAGFELISLPQVSLHGERVSSTAVRQALAHGELGRAAALLGRPYSMSGKVVHGDKLGRELGYPTANVHMRHERPPLYGVYAVKLEGLDGGQLPGVASIGVRPTVKLKARPTLEVHLFDFDRQIYGKHVRVHFLHKLRDEMKFADLTTLQQWMAADEEAARTYLKKSS